ncbi:hypothetical protein ES705_34593 [subsurface metagenome]
MFDLKEERRYRQLRKLGQDLHIPMPEAFLELEVRDKEGRVIQKHRQRSHSWVRNAYNALFSVMAGKDLNDTEEWGGGKLSLKDSAGIIRTGNGPYGYGTTSADGTEKGYRAPAGNSYSGIQVGSGVGVESFEEYVLGTQIENGTDPGKLAHAESEPHSITYTAGTKTLKNELARYFNNNSGGAIDVNEVALRPAAIEPMSGYYLFSRDKLPETVTVPDTGQLKVTYTIQLTYPA